MVFPKLPTRSLNVLLLLVALSSLVIFVSSCGGSKANVRKEESTATQPAAVDVTTTTVIVRDLPKYFEATGSLSADESTDVTPSTAGKVIAVAADLGSYV